MKISQNFVNWKTITFIKCKGEEYLIFLLSSLTFSKILNKTFFLLIKMANKLFLKFSFYFQIVSNCTILKKIILKDNCKCKRENIT